MELLAFINNEKRSLAAFEAYWLQKHKQNPDNYPMNLNANEWWEQFTLFAEFGE